MSRLKVGINGFGRIGRILYRLGLEKLDVVGINDLGDAQTAAHLLKYDSVHRRFPVEVSAEEKTLIVGGRKIPMSSEKDPSRIPWGDWGVDVVLECTGAFKKKEDFLKHTQAGAKKVIVSAPADGADLTVVYGVNHDVYDPSKHVVISNASCTTNCLAPVAEALHSAFGIERGVMTTIHSYTNDQQVLDAPHKDLRRARAAALSMIPTTTGAAKAVGLVLPALKGLLDGVSVRVPTPDVSLIDLVFQSQRDLSVNQINEVLIAASQSRYKGIMHCESEPLVSSDFIGETYSSIVDLSCTMTSGARFGKVFAWYDNEVGFSARMVDLSLWMAKKGI